MRILGVFLDTCIYLGLCHPKDKYAKASELVLEKLTTGDYGLLYTSNLIISEATTLAAIRSKNNLKVLEKLGNLFWGNDKIASSLPFDSDLELETWNLFKKVNTIDLKNEKQ